MLRSLKQTDTIPAVAQTATLHKHRKSEDVMLVKCKFTVQTILKQLHTYF